MDEKQYRAWPSTGSSRRALPEGFWAFNAGSVSCAKLKMRRDESVSNVSENGRKGSSYRTGAERFKSVWYERKKKRGLGCVTNHKFGTRLVERHEVGCYFGPSP